MKLPHPDRILQHFIEHPGTQYTAADLREYLMVPRGDRYGFKKVLDRMVRDGVLTLSQKKRYRYTPNKKEKLPVIVAPRRVVRRRDGKTEDPRHRPATRDRRAPRERRRGEDPLDTIDFRSLTASFLRRWGLTDSFPEEVMREVERLPMTVDAVPEGRADLRDLYTLCIDPIGARDADDAISTRRLDDGGWELWVHIADVSSYVREGGALDREAQERGFTQYMPWQAVPMLPPELSTGICSLKVGEDRLAFSCRMTVSPEGDVTDYRFVKTVIRVDDDPHYALALERAEAGPGPCADLRTVAELLRHRREEKGVLELEMPEAKVVFDDRDEPIAIEQRLPIESMKWIEDCMLATNQCCALVMKEKKLSGLYRIHPAPIPQDIIELYGKQPDLFKNTGFSPRSLYDVEWGDGPGAAVIPELFALFRKLVWNAGDDAEKKRLVLRAMQKARYSTMPLGHFALTWPDYAHFTAPIRRYSDLWCHREISRFLEGGHRRKKGGEERGDLLSEREIEVMKNERQAVKLCAVWIVKDRVGEEFDGKITGLSEWGMWVELLGVGAEGVVRYEALRNDWYTYDPEKDRAVGRRSKQIFRRGDPLRVKLVRVNLDRLELDLEPAAEPSEK